MMTHEVLRHSILGLTFIMATFAYLLFELLSQHLLSTSFMEGVCGVSGGSLGQDKLISKRDL